MRRRLLGIAGAIMLLLSACGGGDDDTAAEGATDEGVRTLGEDPTDEPTEPSAEETTDATEATEPPVEATDAEATEAASSGIPGDTDGDGVLSQAELGAYANTLLLDFSACMRENGFPDFEDMTVDAFVETAGSATGGQAVFFEEMAARGVSLADPASQEALQACGGPLGQLQSIAPTPSAEETAEREADLLDFAMCMREQGIEDWPDPDFGANPGGYGIELTQQFDINSPEIQTAGQACTDQGRGFFPETDG